jgi:hypothetical protein
VCRGRSASAGHEVVVKDTRAGVLDVASGGQKSDVPPPSQAAQARDRIRRRRACQLLAVALHELFELRPIVAVYEDDHDGNGYRVLVDRLWPRGMKKDAAALSSSVARSGGSSIPAPVGMPPTPNTAALMLAIEATVGTPKIIPIENPT